MTSRWSINITPAERAARIVLGAVAVLAGARLLSSASGAPAVVLEALLILAGLDLIVTQARGHCPPYQTSGHVASCLDGHIS